MEESEANGVDPIDPNDHAARAHSRRGFTFANGLDHVVLGELTTTTAFWAQIEPVLQAKSDELFEADWAEARARVGDDACGDDLLRNDSQRWHDALAIILRQGAGVEDPGMAATTAVIDRETLDTELERRDATNAGKYPAPRTTEDAVRRAATYRCETASGMPMSPSDALDYAIAGHVQLFVMNTKTRDFTASARVRLFKGTQRRGILIRDRHCQGRGCDTRANHCEVDQHHPPHRRRPNDSHQRRGPLRSLPQAQDQTRNTRTLATDDLLTPGPALPSSPTSDTFDTTGPSGGRGASPRPLADLR